MVRISAGIVAAGLLFLVGCRSGDADTTVTKPPPITWEILSPKETFNEGCWSLALPSAYPGKDGKIDRAEWGLFLGTPKSERVGGMILSCGSEWLRTDYNALYLALLWASTRDNSGVECSPGVALARVNYSLIAASANNCNVNCGGVIGVVATADRNYGLLLGGIGGIAIRNHGLETGLETRTVVENRGLQLGVFNYAAPGAPFGSLYQFEPDPDDPPPSEAVNALQIGIYNRNEFGGPSLQIGVWNHNPAALIPWLPLCNWN